MADDDFDVLAPDPLLAGSDGDEAPRLTGSDGSARRWLGVAAGVGVGSAAIAAAVMFWGRKEPPTRAAPSPAPKAGKKPTAVVANASDGSAD